MAVAYDLTIPAGDTWRSPRWALVIGGTVIDLTDGWTVKAQIRAYPQAATTLYDFDTDNGVELGEADFTVDGDPVTGVTVRLHLTAAQSAGLSGLTGVWDLEASHPTFDGGQPYRKTLVSGRVRATAEVTR